MPKSATMTLRVTEDLKAKISRLAEETDRTPSAVAQRGLSAYVDQQLWMLAEVDRSLEDFADGRVVSHDDAMARVRQTLARHSKVQE